MGWSNTAKKRLSIHIFFLQKEIQGGKKYEKFQEIYYY